jgi:hypothetical protein
MTQIYRAPNSNVWASKIIEGRSVTAFRFGIGVGSFGEHWIAMAEQRSGAGWRFTSMNRRRADRSLGNVFILRQLHCSRYKN